MTRKRRGPAAPILFLAGERLASHLNNITSAPPHPDAQYTLRSQRVCNQLQISPVCFDQFDAWNKVMKELWVGDPTFCLFSSPRIALPPQLGRQCVTYLRPFFWQDNRWAAISKYLTHFDDWCINSVEAREGFFIKHNDYEDWFMAGD